MKLNVVPTLGEDGKPWYGQGLEFTCSQCGNCCTGGPGFVWISDVEVQRLADFLKITPQETIDRYCRDVAGRRSLNERQNAAGAYDCIFLTEQPARPGDGGTVALPKKGCSIYPVRPLQCRTWPFWPENLRDRRTWNKVARRCHGMNQGRQFTQAQIETIRDAEDWPASPPTSASEAGTGSTLAKESAARERSTVANEVGKRAPAKSPSPDSRLRRAQSPVPKAQ